MAKTSHVLIPPGFDIGFNKVLCTGDRFYTPRLRFKRTFVSRKRKAQLSQKSEAIILSPVWQGFTTAEQTAWNNAGLASQMSGFKLFVQDTCLRIRNALTGYSIPSIIYQSHVGKLDFLSGAVDSLLVQLHPLTYWVERKVHGTRDQYEDIPVTESFGLPLTISISWKALYTSIGIGSSLKFYAEVYSNYQGNTITTLHEIDLTSGLSWSRQSVTLTSVHGVIRGYTLFIRAVNVQGVLYFDNVEAIHSGHNWVRDPRCNNVAANFGRRFYQVPKHWIFERVDTGVELSTVYNYESL